MEPLLPFLSPPKVLDIGFHRPKCLTRHGRSPRQFRLAHLHGRS
jgi:hypothetical protein